MKLHRITLAAVTAAAAFAASAQSLPAPGTPNGSYSVTPPTATMPAERWNNGAARPSDPAPTAAASPSGTVSPAPQIQAPVTRDSARSEVYRGLRNGAIPNGGEEYSHRLESSPNAFDPVN